MKTAGWMRMRMLGVVVGLSLIPGLGCEAQSAAAGQQTGGWTVEELHPQAIRAPFPLDAGGKSRQALEFLAPEQMSAADRELAEANQAEIARRAGLQGFSYAGHVEEGMAGRGGWGYEQAVCPVFPGHLILEYSRSEGQGDVTLFAAVIPRGEGHVRVIPVRRRGYSLWTPASSNALTIHDFNHMVQEGPSHAVSPDWLTLGLCYAALAGGHVRAALAAQTEAQEAYPLMMPAMLTEGVKDGAEIRFVDSTPNTKPMEWILSFAGDGRLLKVKHVAATELVEKPVLGNVVDVGEELPPAQAGKRK